MGALALGIQSTRLGGSPGHLQGPRGGLAGDILGSPDWHVSKPQPGHKYRRPATRETDPSCPTPLSPRYSVMLLTRMFTFLPKPPQRWPSAPARGQAAVKAPCAFPGLSLPGAYTAIPWETCCRELLSRALTTVLLPFWVTQKLRIWLDFLSHPLKHKRTPSLLGN